MRQFSNILMHVHITDEFKRKKKKNICPFVLKSKFD